MNPNNSVESVRPTSGRETAPSRQASSASLSCGVSASSQTTTSGVHARHALGRPLRPRARLTDLGVFASSFRAPLRDASSLERERGRFTPRWRARAGSRRRETRDTQGETPCRRTNTSSSSRSGAHTLSSTRSLFPPPTRARVAAPIHAAPRPVFRLDTAAAARQPESDGRFPLLRLLQVRPPADYYEKKRKKEAREPQAQRGGEEAHEPQGEALRQEAPRGEGDDEENHQQHSERTNKHKVEEDAAPGAIPRTSSTASRRGTKVLSNTIKQKRKEDGQVGGAAAQGAPPRMRCSA